MPGVRDGRVLPAQGVDGGEQAGLVVLDRGEQVIGLRIFHQVAGSFCWTCKASAVTSAPGMSSSSSSRFICVISLVLTSASRWAGTARAPQIIAASRCGAFSSPACAPRTVLPSSAISSAGPSASPAFSWPFSQVPNAVATARASSRPSTRWNVRGDGGISRPRRSRRTSSAASTFAGVSEAHSLSAAGESAPASTAAAVNGQSGRRPVADPAPAPRPGRRLQAFQ